MPTAALRSRCARCGPVEVPIEDVELDEAEGDRGGGGAYTFRCPRCGQPKVSQADGPAARVLRAAGARSTGPGEHGP